MKAEELQQLAAEVRSQVMSRYSLSSLTDEELQSAIDELLKGRTGTVWLSIEERVYIANQVFGSIRGFGILDVIMNDDSITEVMVNGPDEIFIEQNGRVRMLEEKFESERRLEDIIQRIVGLAGREVNQANPIVDTRWFACQCCAAADIAERPDCHDP